MYTSRLAIALALSIFTSTVYVVNVESWPAAELTQETHFSFDSKPPSKLTAININGFVAAKLNLFGIGPLS